ncbi:MAG: glycosyltransferase [Vicingaceae bacterium]
MSQHKTILITPLNWGLGHASRCIPVIIQLLKLNCKVVVAADGEALQLLKSEFPELTFEVFPGLKTTYSKFIPIPVLLLLRSPKLFKSIKKEHNTIRKLVENYHVDGIISDNRYGCYSSDIPSVIITHQLAIKTPLLKKHAQQLIEKLLSKFNATWVPDFEGEQNISGDLSHISKPLKNTHFLGPLTRFVASSKDQAYSRKLLVLLSGPEPQRTLFEKKIVEQLQDIDYQVLIVRGKLNQTIPYAENDYLKFEAHLPTAQLQQEIEASELVLCRSGYSSLMDLARIGKKVLLVPTPGQSEQEYLAKRLSKNGICYTVRQSKLSLSKDVEKALKFKAFQLEQDSKILERTLREWLAEIS